MLELGIMNQLFFSDYHRTLFPVVFMTQAKNRLELEEKSKELETLKTNDSDLGKVETVTPPPNPLPDTSQEDRKLTPEQAYSELVNSQPQNDFDRKIKEFFLKNLPVGALNKSGGTTELKSLISKRRVSGISLTGAGDKRPTG